MGALLSLVAAICYGTSDFYAGVGGRRGDSSAVAMIVQPLALVAAVIAVPLVPRGAPTVATLGWGALAGLGSGAGTLALYRGLAMARMSVVAPLSGAITAALPAVVGAAFGDRLSAWAWVGVGLAVPAALLVSLHREPPGGRSRRAGVGYGVAAGVGFAVLYIALARAGTSAGAWPLIPTQVISLGVIAALVARGRRRIPRGAWRASLRPAVVAGALGGIASLAYLAATGAGQLAAVAAITALYPAATVVLARVVEHEHWARVQVLGLVCAAASVMLTGLG